MFPHGVRSEFPLVSRAFALGFPVFIHYTVHSLYAPACILFHASSCVPRSPYFPHAFPCVSNTLPYTFRYTKHPMYPQGSLLRSQCFRCELTYSFSHLSHLAFPVPWPLWNFHARFRVLPHQFPFAEIPFLYGKLWQWAWVRFNCYQEKMWLL